jgi:hypothetical protein
MPLAKRCSGKLSPPRSTNSIAPFWRRVFDPKAEPLDASSSTAFHAPQASQRPCHLP